MKARINGMAAIMKEFNFLFGLMLAEKLLKHAACKLFRSPTEHFFLDTPERFYKQTYFECFHVVVSALKDPFQQHDYSSYANMEQLLIKACSKADYFHELQDVTKFFNNDFNKSELETPFQLLRYMNIECSGKLLTIRGICKHSDVCKSPKLFFCPTSLVL